jgi:hypothetical protein
MYFNNGEYMGDADDKKELFENIMFLPESFEKAQLYFYLGHNSLGIQALMDAANESGDENAALALFEIYYYGLFGQKVSFADAQRCYELYKSIPNSWE